MFAVCVIQLSQELEGESEKNRESLAKLDSALFVLSLDDSEVADEVGATHTLLHNHGNNRYATPPV